MDKLWTPDNSGKVIPVVRVRPLQAPPPTIGARLQAQHLHWQLGRYVEDLSFGPGGRGRKKRWVVDQEAEQHNLVLNQTYDSLISQYGFMALNDYAVVGTGSTPPAASQTGLANEVRRTRRDENGSTSGTMTITRPSNGVYEIQRVREFIESEVGNLNLTEWGFSPASSAGNNLMSRELFRDGNGDPTVITPASDQRLRLIYKTRLSIVGGGPVSVNISGIGILSGVFYLNGGSVLATGVDWDRNTDLSWVDAIARGSSTVAANNGGVVVFNQYVPTTYSSSPLYQSSQVSWLKSLTFSQITRGRKVNPVTFAANEANITIRSIGLGLNGSGTNWFRLVHGINLDSGQEFTKTNLYRLTIGEWTLTWGP